MHRARPLLWLISASLLGACGGGTFPAKNSSTSMIAPEGRGSEARFSGSGYSYIPPKNSSRGDQQDNGFSVTTFTARSGSPAVAVAILPSTSPDGRTLDGTPLDTLALMIVGHQTGTTVLKMDPLAHRLVAGDPAVEVASTLRDQAGSVTYGNAAVFRRGGRGTVYIVTAGGLAADRAAADQALLALLDSWSWSSSAVRSPTL